jgi:hypothetical protein
MGSQRFCEMALSRDVDTEAATSDGGGCASRWRPRNLGRADTSWGGAGACLAWLTVLCCRCDEAVGSIDCLRGGSFDF